MSRTHRSLGPLCVAIVATMAVSGCTIKKSDAPALTGPSELGTSISIFANPDVLAQDGASQSQIVVQARDANGQAIRDLGLRAEIWVNGIPTDFGRLSARNVVTGPDGRASFAYTAPAPPPDPVDTLTIVTIVVVPTGTDFANAVARQVNIRLAPPGVILPPNGTPVARFTYSPTSISQGDTIQFDASSTSDDGQIVSFGWDFGDGTTGSGMRTTHAFSKPGSYQVTLTVTDDRGLSASTTQLILVLTTANPSASFTFSPTTPAAGDTVFFNASGSRPADGRRIVSYFWTFGDGATGSGVTTSHPYLASGNFTPTLTVTDDLGKTATSSALVIVGSSQTPTASFVYSPANPTVNQTITFDASPSTAPQGRTIVSYAWRFGDGATGSGRVVQHSYPTPQDYVVVLTVTDSAGATNTTSRTVGVGSGAAQNPTADFTVSPSPAKSGQTVTFDGSLSKASAGATIVQYRWNFGDGTPTFVTAEPVTNHTYVVLNSTTFTITLTVVDSNGRTASSFKTLTVDP